MKGGGVSAWHESQVIVLAFVPAGQLPVAWSVLNVSIQGLRGDMAAGHLSIFKSDTKHAKVGSRQLKKEILVETLAVPQNEKGRLPPEIWSVGPEDKTRGGF